MAKALAEQKTILNPRREETPGEIEPVLEGGRMRRIFYQDTGAPASASPRAARTPPPTAVVFHERQPIAKTHDSLQVIHSEVDHLRTTRPGGKSGTARTRTLYETPGGEVMEALVPTTEGRRRILYVTHTEDGRVVERRFSSAAVDRLVKGVKLDGPSEPATVDLSGEATAPVEATPEPQTPKRGGLFGFFRRKQPAEGEEKDYIPIEPGVPLVEFTSRPLEEPAWTPPASLSSAPVARALPASARKPRRKAARKAATKPRKARPAKPAAAYLDYKGDMHLVIELEGIGPTYAKRLQAAGIHTTDRLCYEKAVRVARIAKAPLKTARTWQSMAGLVKVKGIGPQYAEALSRAGVNGIDGLKASTPKAIAAKVTKYLDGLEASVVGSSVTPKRVQAWQRTARRMRKVRQPAPPTGAPVATTWYEKARATKAAKELKTGSRKAARSASRRRKTGGGSRPKRSR